MPNSHDRAKQRPRRGQALLARADARFEATCLNGNTTSRNHCMAMGRTLTSYAAFHTRVFDEATPCSERRVLIVRESFSDIVGVGHAHMGLQRFLALGLALGRAVVFSHCTSSDDPWLVRGRAIWKNAAPYTCEEPHLSVGEHYVGFGGIDLRWDPPKQKLLRACGYTEMPLDLNDKMLPQMANQINPHGAFRVCKRNWKGCISGWNHDQMGCDFRARGGCPTLSTLFGPAVPQNESTSPPPPTRRRERSPKAPGSVPRKRSHKPPDGRMLQQRDVPSAAATPRGGGGKSSGRGFGGEPIVRGAAKGRGATRRVDVEAAARGSAKGRGAKARGRPAPKRPAPLPPPPPPLPPDVISGFANAPVLGLYNARRDGGAYGLPSWQLAVGNGKFTVGAPNGSSIGIASEADLRDTLTCPYQCWAHANFQPASLLRRLLERASRKLSPSAPLTCAHLRTMWVDDHRCAPNPRGCHPVEFRRLVYWNTSGSIAHGTGQTQLPSGGARAALDGNPLHWSRTEGRLSPLWWRMEVQTPLPYCLVQIRLPRGLGSVMTNQNRPERVRRRNGRQDLRAAPTGGAGEQLAVNSTTVAEPPRRLRVSVLAADGVTVVWSGLTSPLAPTPQGGVFPGQSFDVRLPSPTLGKFVQIEMEFDERNAPVQLSMQVDIFTDEQLTWPNIDRYVNPEPCKLVAWRGTCPGTFHKTMLPMLGGWSGFVKCAATSGRFRDGLLKSQSTITDNGPTGAIIGTNGERDPFVWAHNVDGMGRRLLVDEAAADSPGGAGAPPPVYFSTDSPAVQQLALETYPRQLVTIEGEPVPSWARNKSSADYAKVLADFEMLKLCDVIVGPVSSNYAKTAAIESMLSRGYLTQHGMCTFDGELTREAHVATPSYRGFERARGVEGMFADCTALG